MTYDDPIITYDGLPTEAFFGQLLAKVEAVPAATIAAAQITPIHADVKAGQPSVAAAVWAHVLP